MTEQNYTIRVKLGETEIEVGGDKEFVKEEIQTLLKEIKPVEVNKNIEEEKKQSETKSEKIYIKDFTNEKKPSNHLETAVTLAYFLYKFEKKEEFKFEDLKEIWIASEAKAPKKIWQTIIDGRGSHSWFEKTSRGIGKISPYGIHFVENDLPKKTSKM